MVSAVLARRIRELPDRPGIYVFLDSERRPLYVGKASSLRKRGASYISGQHEARIATMLHEAVDVEFVVTCSQPRRFREHRPAPVQTRLPQRREIAAAASPEHLREARHGLRMCPAY